MKAGRSSTVAQKLLAALLALFGEAPALVEDAQALEETAWREVLDEVRTLLQAGNMTAVDLVEQLQPQVPAAQREAFADFFELVSALDFPAACPTSHLGDLLIRSFSSAEVRKIQDPISVPNPDYGHFSKVQPLGDHLSPNQDVYLSSSKFI